MPRLRARLLLATASVAAALVAGELGVRLLVPRYAPREGSPQVRLGGPGEPYYRMRPRSEFTHVWDGDPYGTLPAGARLTYRLDDDGYRLAPGSGAPVALLVLGDSFAFGEGVEVGRRFADLLDVPSTFDAGVPGWSALDEVAALPELLATRRPRAVLLVAQPNDAVPITHAQERAEGDLLAPGAASGSRLLELLGATWRARATEAWYRSYWTGAERRFGDEVGASLADAERLCAASGARLGVACFPLLHRLDDYPLRAVHEELRRHVERAGAAWLDLLPAFEGRDARELWVHPTDHHPNARAHAVAAEALRPFVRELLAVR